MTRCLQVFLITICVSSATGAPVTLPKRPAALDVTPYVHALYPNGISPQRNQITGLAETPEILLSSVAALPGSNREVIVFAERFEKNLKSDKIYRVYVATLQLEGDSRQLLDRHEVTEELELFTEFPGNFLGLRSTASWFAARGGVEVAAIDLWTTLSGSGLLNEATELLFSVGVDGKLTQLLKLPNIYGSAISGGWKTATIARLFAGKTDRNRGDLLVTKRTVRWNDDGVAQCGAIAVEYYRLAGSSYKPESGQDFPAADYVESQNLSFQEKPPCAN